MQPWTLHGIRSRAEAATPGPWWMWGGQQGHPDGQGGGPCVIRGPDEGEGARPLVLCREQHDQEFIARARDDIPALLAELERLHDELTFVKCPACGVQTLPDAFCTAVDEEVERRVPQWQEKLARLQARLDEVLPSFTVVADPLDGDGPQYFLNRNGRWRVGALAWPALFPSVDCADRFIVAAALPPDRHVVKILRMSRQP